MEKEGAGAVAEEDEEGFGGALEFESVARGDDTVPSGDVTGAVVDAFVVVGNEVVEETSDGGGEVDGDVDGCNVGTKAEFERLESGDVLGEGVFCSSSTGAGMFGLLGGCRFS